MINLTCGFPLQKAARIIAIADMVYCFVSVILRSSIAVVLASYYVQVPYNQTGYEVPNSNSNLSVQIKPLTLTPIKSETFAAEDPMEDEELSVAIGGVFSFFIVLMTGIVLYIVLELWMCRLLLGAAKNLDKENCKKWWWYRLSITMILLFICIILTLFVNRGWFSWAMELVIFYRAYELLVIHQFKNEIGATSSRVQIRNSPQ